MSLNQNLQNYLNTNNPTLDKYIISTFYKFLVLENYKELKIKFDKSLSKTKVFEEITSQIDFLSNFKNVDRVQARLPFNLVIR